jgi:hypothetical protein
MTRAAQDVSWFRFACEYMDMKWPTPAATYRRESVEVALELIDHSPHDRESETYLTASALANTRL